MRTHKKTKKPKVHSYTEFERRAMDRSQIIKIGQTSNINSSSTDSMKIHDNSAHKVRDAHLNPLTPYIILLIVFTVVLTCILIIYFVSETVNWVHKSMCSLEDNLLQNQVGRKVKLNRCKSAGKNREVERHFHINGKDNNGVKISANYTIFDPKTKKRLSKQMIMENPMVPISQLVQQTFVDQNENFTRNSSQNTSSFASTSARPSSDQNSSSNRSYRNSKATEELENAFYNKFFLRRRSMKRNSVTTTISNSFYVIKNHKKINKTRKRISRQRESLYDKNFRHAWDPDYTVLFDAKEMAKNSKEAMEQIRFIRELRKAELEKKDHFEKRKAVSKENSEFSQSTVFTEVLLSNEKKKNKIDVVDQNLTSIEAENSSIENILPEIKPKSLSCQDYQNQTELKQITLNHYLTQPRNKQNFPKLKRKVTWIDEIQNILDAKFSEDEIKESFFNGKCNLDDLYFRKYGRDEVNLESFCI